MNRKPFLLLVTIFLLIGFVLGACQPATAEPTEAPEATEATEEPIEEPTEEPMDEPMEDPTKEPEPEPTEEPGLDLSDQTVTFWHVWDTGSAGEGLTKIIDDFNATNEWGITVEAFGQGSQGDLQTAVNTAITTGDLPNVTPGFPNAISTWYNAGAIATLDEFINDPELGLTAEELAAISPANLASGQLPDGTQIGMPIHQSANVVFYNHTWAQELGFDSPPATAAEFKEQACAAAAANLADDNPDNDGTGGLITRGFGASDAASWVFAFGGDFLNDAGDAYEMNTDVIKDVALFLRDLEASGCWLRIDSYPNPEFATRQGLFALSSTAGIPFQAGAFEDAENEDYWNLIAFPGASGNLAVNAYGQLIGVVDISPEANLAAWLWLRHFTSPEIQAEWITFSNYFPSQSTTNEYLGDYASGNEIYSTGLELTQYGVGEPNLASWGAVRGAISDAFFAIFEAEDDAEVDSILENLDAVAAELLAESQ